MNIKEYIVVRDELQHPVLKEKNELQYDNHMACHDNIVDFLNVHFHMNRLNEEYAYVISFNTLMKPLGIFQLSHGNYRATDIKMRELGIFLLLTGAERFVIAHNHPNGSTKISGGDFEITNKMIQFSNLLDIEMIQHYIIGCDGYECAMYDEDDEMEDDDEKMPFSS